MNTRMTILSKAFCGLISYYFRCEQNIETRLNNYFKREARSATRNRIETTEPTKIRTSPKNIAPPKKSATTSTRTTSTRNSRW